MSRSAYLRAFPSIKQPRAWFWYILHPGYYLTREYELRSHTPGFMEIPSLYRCRTSNSISPSPSVVLFPPIPQLASTRLAIAIAITRSRMPKRLNTQILKTISKGQTTYLHTHFSFIYFQSLSTLHLPRCIFTAASQSNIFLVTKKKKKIKDYYLKLLKLLNNTNFNLSRQFTEQTDLGK